MTEYAGAESDQLATTNSCGRSHAAPRERLVAAILQNNAVHRRMLARSTYSHLRRASRKKQSAILIRLLAQMF